MKKLIFAWAVILCPLFSLAQNEPAVIKNFVESARDISSSYAWNDKVNIATINLDNNNSEISAINDRMQVLWRVKLPGYAIATGNFKNKVFVIAATEHSLMKGNNSIYDGFLLEAVTGKVLLQKIIYNGDKEKVEIPSFFSTKDGSFLKLVVRQTDITRKVHVALPGPLALLSIDKVSREYRTTDELTVVDLNENLDPISTVKPAVNGGVLFGIDYNYSGTLFLSWADKAFVTVQKIEPGKKEPTAHVGLQFDLRDNSEANRPDEHLFTHPSTSNQNVIYYSIAHNNSNNDAQLSVAKVDFSNGSKQIVEEMLDKAALKKLEKAYVPINKKINKPSLGYNKDIDVDFMGEDGDNLVISMVNNHVETGTYTNWLVGESPLINIYDSNLKLKSQTILPSNFGIRPIMGNKIPSAVYHLKNGKLYVVANDKTGMTTNGGLYGMMDLSNGQWNKLERISKSNISSNTMISKDILWYGNGFIAEYIGPAGMLSTKIDITLQLNYY